MTPAQIARKAAQVAASPLAQQAATLVRAALSEAAARYAARMDSPVLWSAFHRLRAEQIKAGRWWPGRGLAVAHHWRMARRYAAMAKAQQLAGAGWCSERCGVQR